MKNFNLETMPLGNGGGSVKTLEDVIGVCRTPMTEIEVGSITMNERRGNIGDTYYFHPQKFWSLNALGLPNPGIEYYKKHLPEMATRANDAGKKLRANIAPFSPNECGELAYFCLQYGADSVVINGSCPNVWDGGKHSAVPALHPASAEALFETTKRYVDSFEPIWFKLSPADDLYLAWNLVSIFRKYGIRKLVCCNTLGGHPGEKLDGSPALAFRAEEGGELHHEGGLGGSRIYHQNLSVVNTFAQFMPEAQIVGLGGIFNGTHVEAYLSAGCIGVQVTTAYLEFGGKVFVDILEHLADKIAA